MNEKQAETVAQAMADFCAAEMKGQEDLERAFGRVHRAVFYKVRHFFPDGATTALIQREGDNAPMIVAVEGQQLYLLTVGKLDDGLGLPPTECRMLHVEPGAGSVILETTYRDRRGDTSARSTTWTFELSEGTKLVVGTHFDPQESRWNDREALGRALAGALGWGLPSFAPSEPLVAVV